LTNLYIFSNFDIFKNYRYHLNDQNHCIVTYFYVPQHQFLKLLTAFGLWNNAIKKRPKKERETFFLHLFCFSSSIPALCNHESLCHHYRKSLSLISLSHTDTNTKSQLYSSLFFPSTSFLHQILLSYIYPPYFLIVTPHLTNYQTINIS